MIKSINELVLKAQEIKTKTMVVACAADQHVLKAVEMARRNNIVNGILVGNKEKIEAILKTLNYNEKNYKIIDEKNNVDACITSVKLVNENKDRFLMKGLVDTSIILKAALNKEFGLRTSNRISHVSVMEVPTHNKLIFMSDGAMNIAPNIDEKRQIIENSVLIA
ncbi:MAG: phosphate butyryltransferase, partial [Candidatus Izimaplasma sp.]|nr:phosphate butyryltransferase [Candidatus Izimaplasma bacterium]